jgi:hypothetical protein
MRGCIFVVVLFYACAAGQDNLISLENALKGLYNVGIPNGPKGPVLPPLPDPIEVPSGNYTFDIPDQLTGELYVWDQLIEGLSGLEDKLEIQIECAPVFGFGAAMNIFLPSVYFRGGYDADIVLGLDTMVGNGDFHGGVENTVFDLSFVVGFVKGAPDTFYISQLNLDILIEKLDLFAENFVVSGQPILPDQWPVLSENLRTTFHALWPAIKGPVLANVTVIINNAIKDCHFADYIAFLLGVGDLSCLNLPTPWTVEKNVASPKIPTTLLDVFENTYMDILPLVIAKAEKSGYFHDVAKKIILVGLENVRNSQRAPVFPDLPDPAHLNDTDAEFDLLGLLRGNVSLRNGLLVGMSTVEDDLTYVLDTEPFGLTVNFALTKPGNSATVMVNGTQQSDFHLLLGPIMPLLLIQSQGEYRAGISDAHFKLDVNYGLQTGSSKVELKELALDMGFNQLRLFADEVILGDCLELPVYWQGMEVFFKRIFEILWANNPHKQLVVTYIKDVVNSVIKECTDQEIIDYVQSGAELTCLSPPVFPPLPPLPTTTRGTTTTTRGTTTSTTLKPDPSSPTDDPGNPSENPGVGGAVSNAILSFQMLTTCFLALAWLH